MALFFDQAWFDGALTALGRSRDDLAAALGLSAGEIAEIFKDQRELDADAVRAIAAFLGKGAEEVAERAGISTPRPSLGWRTAEARAAPRTAQSEAPGPILARLASIETRLSRIEAALALIEGRLGGP